MAKETTSAAKASAAETQQQHREAEAAHSAAQTTLEQATAQMAAARHLVDRCSTAIRALNARRGAPPPPSYHTFLCYLCVLRVVLSCPLQGMLSALGLYMYIGLRVMC